MMIGCPSCGTQLQPLGRSSPYASRAWVHAQQMDLPIPQNGPAALMVLALVSHAMTVHDGDDLEELLRLFRVK